MLEKLLQLINSIAARFKPAEAAERGAVILPFLDTSSANANLPTELTLVENPEASNIVFVHFGADTELASVATEITTADMAQRADIAHCFDWAGMIINGEVETATRQIEVHTQDIDHRSKLVKLIEVRLTMNDIDVTSGKYKDDLDQVRETLGIPDRMAAHHTLELVEVERTGFRIPEKRAVITEIPRALKQAEALKILGIDSDQVSKNEVALLNSEQTLTVTEAALENIIPEDYSARLWFSNVNASVIKMEFNGANTRMVTMDKEALEDTARGKNAGKDKDELTIG